MSLKINNLTKSYGAVPALDHMNLDIAPKQVFGLLGPNGAGKTTLIRILCQLARPDAGSVSIHNRKIRDAVEAKAMIGLVPQTNNLHGGLTVFENLLFHARYYGISRKDAAERAEKLLAEFGLTQNAGKQIHMLSGGTKQRVLIARALIQSPEILIMDEPTVGLDPIIRKELWEMIRNLKKEHTVLLTTQYIEEAEELCDEVAIMDRGKLVVRGRPAELKKEVGDVQYHETTLEDVFMKYTHRTMHGGF